MVKACEKQSRLFAKEYNVNLYRSFVSLPGVAIKVGFRYLENYPVFIPSEEDYKLFRTTPGGQSILFTLEAIAGITKIKQREFGLDALTVQSIFSLDASFMVSILFIYNV